MFEHIPARYARALIVQEFHPSDIDALDYLAHTSRQDPTEVRV
jgi:hypothetical protein